GTGSWRRRLLPLAPFVLNSAVFTFVSLSVAQYGLAQYTLGGSRLGTWVNDGPILLRYVSHTLAPLGLAFFYDVPELSPDALQGWGAWLLLLSLAGSTVWWI